MNQKGSTISAMIRAPVKIAREHGLDPREIDARVGRSIGDHPRVVWRMLNPDGSAFSEQPYEVTARRWATQLEGRSAERVEVWPRYSRDIGAAWRVVVALKANGDSAVRKHFHDRLRTISRYADGDAAMMICLAALEALRA